MNKHKPGEMGQESTDILDRKWIDVNIPCKAACPIQTNIPEYIRAIATGDYQTAYLINRQDNVLPSILGRICSRPCESACRHGWDGLGDPVAICFLKRSAADFGLHEFKQDITPIGKSVCIIGAGPSGLTAANDLALKGYQVSLLEQFDEPGGMLRYGIPRFRLPLDIVQQDVKSITDLGVNLQTGTRIETSEQIRELTRQYNAVIMAGGCMSPKRLDIPGLDADGVTWGLDYMMDANTYQIKKEMEKVVVVGGGFTSVDCTRMAHRLGAKKITMSFLFTKNDMTVGEHEIEDMEAEGIEFAFLVTPIGIETDNNNRVTGVRFMRNSVGKDNSIEKIKGSDFVISADRVVFAIGQEEEKYMHQDFNDDDATLFTAGDFRNGASTVIQACAQGRKTAQRVHSQLSGVDYEDVISIEPVTETGRVREMDFIPLQPMDKIPLQERAIQDKEVDTGYSIEKSATEANRCYLCHYNFQIDIDRCIYCLACIDVMPVDCIKMAKDVVVDNDGNMSPVPADNWEQVQAIVIDNNKCIRCGNCVRACPVDCISISRYSLHTRKVEKK